MDSTDTELAALRRQVESIARKQRQHDDAWRKLVTVAGVILFLLVLAYAPL